MGKQEGTPLVRFSLKDGRVYFNYSVLIPLGTPKYVQLLYEENRKLLMVSGNNEKLPGSLAIPKSVYQHRMKNFRICHKHLAEAFLLRLGWDRDESYSVTGSFDQLHNIVVFELMMATKTELDLKD